MAPTAMFSNCTCCVIKPHIVASGQAGLIIDAILEEGFEISAIQMFNMDKPTAEEFFEIYKGVLPEFTSIIDQMVIGPCIVCLLYTSPSPRDRTRSRMPSSA